MRSIAIILAGGVGSRLGGDIPKQYIYVQKKPIILYCLEQFQKSLLIDGIVVVAASEWQDRLFNTIQNCGISKFIGFAFAGSSRQESVLSGLKFIEQKNYDMDVKVLIHDAARPNITQDLIERCFEGLKEADGVMPVIPVKDAVYYSENGAHITSLLDRDKIFAGQTPEAFWFKKYFELHKNMNSEELSMIKGSSEIAYRGGLKIKIVDGDENNYKITTNVDLAKFTDEKEKEE